MSNARQGWNAAQLASERPLSGRKSHAPVGTPVVIDWGGGTVDVVHKCCGYHVCNCPATPVARLLTYDQAVAACRAGAVLQVTGGVQAGEWVGTCIRFVPELDYFQTNLDGHWSRCRLKNNGIQFRICP